MIGKQSNLVGTDHGAVFRYGNCGRRSLYILSLALILGLLSSLVLASRAQGAPSAECARGHAPYRINAGGPELSSPLVFCRDRRWAPSPYVNAETAGNKTLFKTDAVIEMSDPSIPAGTPEALFKSERWDPVEGAEMAWAFPVEPGAYKVRLYFAEIWNNTQRVGARKFDVFIEGDKKLDDYDVFAEAGGGYKRIVETFTVTSDETLKIRFEHEVENPAVKAIEILPATEPGNQPPVLQPISEQSATEDQEFSLHPQASDPDNGDVLNYAVEGLPEGLSVDPQAGEISGKPALGTAANSPYIVEATVSDGAASDSESFTLKVSKPSLGDTVDPTIGGMRPKPGSKVAHRTLKIGAIVRDETSELGETNIELYLDGKSKAFSYDQQTHKLSCTSGRLFYGRHTVKVVATDEANNEAAERWRFRVVRP